MKIKEELVKTVELELTDNETECLEVVEILCNDFMDLMESEEEDFNQAVCLKTGETITKKDIRVAQQVLNAFYKKRWRFEKI